MFNGVVQKWIPRDFNCLKAHNNIDFAICGALIQIIWLVTNFGITLSHEISALHIHSAHPPVPHCMVGYPTGAQQGRREWSMITINNNPIPPFPSIPTHSLLSTNKLWYPAGPFFCKRWDPVERAVLPEKLQRSRFRWHSEGRHGQFRNFRHGCFWDASPLHIEKYANECMVTMKIVIMKSNNTSNYNRSE